MPFITLQFSRQNDWGSRLIRFFEHGEKYSHVDFVMSDGQLAGARSDEVGGKPAGFQIRPPNYANFAATKRVNIPCTDEQYSAAIQWEKSQVGKGYDKLAILAFALNRNWRDDDEWICSEAQLAMLEEIVLKKKLSIPANKATPADLLLVSSVLTDVNA